MRTALTLFTLAMLAGCTADRPEADTATTPPPETAPDSADEWFVSEHGFRIPLKDQAEFLECAKEMEEVGDWGLLPNGDFRRGAGVVVLIGEQCVPAEAIPAKGLAYCEHPGYVGMDVDVQGLHLPLRGSPELHYCPDASPGTPLFTLMPSSPAPATEAEGLR